MIKVNLPNLVLDITNRNKYKELHKSYERYLFKSDKASQYRLEVAFWRCYGKKASSTLINTLAATKWGPLRSWNVFGYSTASLLSCDYETGKTVLNKKFDSERSYHLTGVKISVLFAIGAFLFFAGIIMIGFHIAKFFNMTFSSMESDWLSLFLMIFLVGTIGPLLTFFGAFLVKESARSMVAEEHDFLAEKLHCLVTSES
ncbi:hypothetical protein P4544_07745 [Halomonas sp. LY9]